MLASLHLAPSNLTCRAQTVDKFIVHLLDWFGEASEDVRDDFKVFQTTPGVATHAWREGQKLVRCMMQCAVPLPSHPYVCVQLNTKAFKCRITVADLSTNFALPAKLVPSTEFFKLVLRRMEREITATDDHQEFSTEMVVDQLKPQAKLWVL